MNDVLTSILDLWPLTHSQIGWLAAVVMLVMAYNGAPFVLWMLLIAGLMAVFGVVNSYIWATFGVFFVLFAIPFIRRQLVSLPLMHALIKFNVLPQISQTEKEAIDAGTVWVDQELFSGKPNYTRILSEAYPSLTPEEQAFIDGPVEQVCQMADTWSIWQNRDLPKEIWAFLKRERFFGMIISKQYGGLGFSAMAHSAVIAKLASRSITLAITVMVPNSLGPGELLSHYGTDEQKKYYLPRLATGEDIPCFALTEPQAGSDAGSITSNGVVFKGDDGKLYMRLNWKKRWITLASISTVIGVAFKLKDPDQLLGGEKDLGITCALVPSDTPGVVIGMRHDPLGVPFYNCPTEGNDVVVPIDAIVGGPKWAGRGWRMLMESLAAGRGISLPSNSLGGGWLVSRIASAFGVTRQQFGMSVGKFEGVEEPLARIVGFTYILEAQRTYTCGGLDAGAKPPVITAMSKYYATELFRSIINDGMDVLGGAAISEGPRNLLAKPYIATPIGITVEGANILTRTLMIFGQGAIRCHPYVLKQIRAIEEQDERAFDHAFFKHVGHVFRNKVRTVVLSFTRARFVPTPGGPLKRYYQLLTWVSSAFAFFADVALGSLGGALKRKEKLTGRFADILAWMYMATTVLRRYHEEGHKEDLPIVHWSLQYAFHQIHVAFEGLFQNMPILRPFGWLMTLFGPIMKAPSDALGHKVAKIIQTPGEQRDRLTSGMFISNDPNDALARYDRAMLASIESEPILKVLKHAVKKGTLPKLPVSQLLDKAVELEVITHQEAASVMEAERLRWDAIQVDAFSQGDYLARKG